MERALLAETPRGNRFDEDRIRASEAAAAEAGTEAKRIGNLRSTARQNIADIATGMSDPIQAKKQAAIFAAHGDLPEAAGLASELMTPPPKPNLTRIRTGQPGSPVEKAFTDEELRAGVQSYQEPKPPQGPAPRDPIADYEARKQIDAKYAKPADAAGPSSYSTERMSRTLQSVEELSKKVTRWTTGAGSLLSRIPETDARNFAAELDTLKANIAFNELTAMREASKTGGALGQVSNVELKLLESALGALDAGQSPDQLKGQLQKIGESVRRWHAAQTSRGGPGGGPARLRFDAQGRLIP